MALYTASQWTSSESSHVNGNCTWHFVECAGSPEGPLIAAQATCFTGSTSKNPSGLQLAEPFGSLCGRDVQHTSPRTMASSYSSSTGVLSRWTKAVPKPTERSAVGDGLKAGPDGINDGDRPFIIDNNNSAFCSNTATDGHATFANKGPVAVVSSPVQGRRHPRGASSARKEGKRERDVSARMCMA